MVNKILFTLLLSILYMKSTQAQKYSLISQYDSIEYFTNNIGYLKGLRIDSMHITTEGKIHFPFKTLRVQHGDYGTQADTTGGSWVGEKIVEIDNWTYIPNQIGDTLKIKQDAVLSENWIFFEAADYNTYIGTVVNFDTITIDGIEDSIKTIRITSYDDAMEVDETDSLNGLEFSLSKSHGLIKGFEFYLFPELGQNLYSSTGEGTICDVYLYAYTYSWGNYSKQGLTFNRVKIVDTSAADYASFSINDFTVSKFIDGGMYGGGTEFHIFHDTIKAITDYPNRISYTINRLFQDKWANLDDEGNFTSGTEFTNSEITKDYSKTSFFSIYLPEERFCNALYFYDGFDSSFCVRSPKLQIVGESIFNEEGIYYGYSYTSVSTSYKKYFGQVSNSYVYQAFDQPEDFWIYTMVGSSNGIACESDNDTSLSISKIPLDKFHFDIFPNPAKNQLTIKVTKNQEKFDIKIYDLTGREVFFTQQVNSGQQIPLPTLMPGFYLVEICQKEKKGVQKLVIQ